MRRDLEAIGTNAHELPMIYSAFFHRLHKSNYCIVIICTIVCDASNALSVALLFFEVFSWLP